MPDMFDRQEDEAGRHIIFLLSDLKSDIAITKTIMDDIRKHQNEMLPKVSAMQSQIRSLEQSRQGLHKALSALWALVTVGFTAYLSKFF